MLTEKNIYSATRFCCEDISLIENYDKAMNDNEKYECHHKLGIIKTKKELIELGIYYNRPACELIFLTKSEHKRLHSKNRNQTQETREKISISNKGKKRTQQQCENISKAVKKIYESQDNRKKISDGTKKALQRPEVRKKMRQPRTKYRWQTPDGETRIMCKQSVSQYHKDWVLIGPIK